MERVGGASSSRMVPSPLESAIAAPVAVSRSPKKVSLGSTVVSPFRVTRTVFASSPGAKLRVPLVAT
jgi:hypothetical protein